MNYDPTEHHRRSIRLKGYDYTQPGAYFVTLVTQGRECLFGEIVDGVMKLNGAGEIAQQEWQRLARQFTNLLLDAFVIMPNHIHAIIVITEPVGSPRRSENPLPDQMFNGSPRQSRPHGPPPGSLGSFVGQFKSRLTKCLGLAVPVFQRNYYEHIIRNEAEWERIAAYIQANPANWQTDKEYSIR